MHLSISNSMCYLHSLQLWNSQSENYFKVNPTAFFQCVGRFCEIMQSVKTVRMSFCCLSYIACVSYGIRPTKCVSSGFIRVEFEKALSNWTDKTPGVRVIYCLLTGTIILHHSIFICFVLWYSIEELTSVTGGGNGYRYDRCLYVGVSDWFSVRMSKLHFYLSGPTCHSQL